MDCDSNLLKDCRHRLEWMKDKPPFVALMASAAVLAADECYALLKVCAGEQAVPVTLSPQSVRKWLRLYSRRNAITKALVEVFSETFVSILQGSEDEIDACLIGDSTTVGRVDIADDALWRRAFERIE